MSFTKQHGRPIPGAPSGANAAPGKLYDSVSSYSQPHVSFAGTSSSTARVSPSAGGTGKAATTSGTSHPAPMDAKHDDDELDESLPPPMRMYNRYATGAAARLIRNMAHYGQLHTCACGTGSWLNILRQYFAFSSYREMHSIRISAYQAIRQPFVLRCAVSCLLGHSRVVYPNAYSHCP